MNSENLIKQFSLMHRIRIFEEKLLEIYATGIIKGTIHTCIGQEACAVGVIGALNSEIDNVCSNHRGHGHFLAFGGEIISLLNEILGNENGVCKGVGGSQHLHIKNYYSNGILGGMIPVATGIAYSQKLNKTNGVTVAFVGDGAMAEGVIYESLNIAALWNLPLLLVVENNKIAQSTPTEKQHSTKIESIPAAFGLSTTVTDGNDIINVISVSNRIINEIRQTSEPQCLVLNTYRLGPHSKGDDTRSKEELVHSRKFDPISLIERRLDHNLIEEIKQVNINELNYILAKCGVLL